jgi:hypothetical protein
MPEHSYKLHVLSTTQHLGELDWKQFKDSMLEELPHIWKNRQDTRFELAHFEKRTKSGSGDPSASKWTTEDIGLPSSHISGLPGGGLAPHVASDHIQKPNVVVAHHKEGIEVVHLYTGRTLCRMKLQDGLYADINGDGIIDRIQAFSGHIPGNTTILMNLLVQLLLMAESLSNLLLVWRLSLQDCLLWSNYSMPPYAHNRLGFLDNSFLKLLW